MRQAAATPGLLPVAVKIQESSVVKIMEMSRSHLFTILLLLILLLILLLFASVLHCLAGPVVL